MATLLTIILEDAMRQTRRSFLTLTASFASALASGSGWSQSYPTRTVRIMVGFPQGGPLDIAARIIAPALTARFGQEFEVVNMPGASGNEATAEVAAAPADGQTLLLCGPVHVINTMLFEKLPFDFTRDITPVAGLARVPLVIETTPSLPVRTLPELIDLARKTPGAIKAAYAGNGTPQHVAIELFRTMTGADFALAPYLGSAPALEALLKGDVQVMFDPLPSSINHVRAGKLIALATTGPERSAVLPDVPAANEIVPGFEGGSWFGLGAPVGTPADVVAQLSRAIAEALVTEQVRSKFSGLGGTLLSGASADFAAFIGRENDRFRDVIRKANIRL
jgi:tripartite-type tricarboxylate transporter receptor subunit TctC